MIVGFLSKRRAKINPVALKIQGAWAMDLHGTSIIMCCYGIVAVFLCHGSYGSAWYQNPWQLEKWNFVVIAILFRVAPGHC